MLCFYAAKAEGQNIEAKQNFPSDIRNFAPENVMREVVGRILTYKIKPSRQRKIIYLSSQFISSSWLPQIKNIEFRLLSADEVEDIDEKIYFFTEPEFQAQGIYEIGFAFGDPNCNYSGDTWRFRVTAAGKVRLWESRGGFGGGCAVGSDTEFKSPGALNTYPNELKGYEFFDRGRLKGLRLGISTREDVKNIFGASCETSCDYDRNWRINFSYFENNSKEVTIGKNKPVKYVPDAQYIGKLYSIALSPKSEVFFGKVVFSSKFRKGKTFTAAHDGIGGGTNSMFDTYTDRYGLQYTLLDKILLTTEKNLKWRQGELRSIEYAIPGRLEEKMFVEQTQ